MTDPGSDQPEAVAHVPTVSLCMIVRNAERSLDDALSSVAPFVDELIIVDTGSADRTIDIAGAHGASVHHFVWCDDFSAARNFSLDQATGDWVFWMDADDVLPEESGREMRRVIAEHSQRDVAFWVHLEQETVKPDGRKRCTRHGHLKLFPNHPQIRFRYRVHEQVAPAIKELGLPLKATSIVVRHAHADRSPAAEAARMRRNLRLIELDHQEHPNDPSILFHFALTCLAFPELAARAEDYARRSVEGFQFGSSARLNSYLLLCSAQRRFDKHEEELRTCIAASAEYPDDANVLYRLASLRERAGDFSEAAKSYRQILRSGRQRLAVLHQPDVHGKAMVGLGRVLLSMGRRDETEKLWSRYLERRPDAACVRAALTNLLLKPHTIVVDRTASTRKPSD